MRGQMSRQMYSLYTGASDAERNTSKFLNREVNILETSVERLIENLPHTEELAGRIASRYKMPTGFGSRTLTKIRSTEKASGVMRSKIWNQVNKALTEEIPISELPETLQPTVGIIRETLDTLTKDILDSPTLPPKQFLDLDDQFGIHNATEKDIDDDGFLDLFFTNRTFYSAGKQITPSDRNFLLRNKGNDNNWIKIELEGTESNRDAYGARVKMVAGSLTQYREHTSAHGYNSANDLRLHFGLADNAIVDSIEVLWPSGKISEYSDIGINQLLTLKE